jgi:hypothetical protein
VLFYRAALSLSRQPLSFVTGVISRHRKFTGSRWRKLRPGHQSLLVLAYLRNRETFAQLAAGFGVGTTTTWRYVEETVALLEKADLITLASAAAGMARVSAEPGALCAQSQQECGHAQGAGPLWDAQCL